MTPKVKEVQDATSEAAHLLTLIETAAGLISDLSLNDGDDALLEGTQNTGDEGYAKCRSETQRGRRG